MVGLRGAHQRNSSRKRKRTGADEGKHSPSIRPRGKRSSKAATCWLSTSPAMARQHRNERDQYYYLNKEAHNTEIDRDAGLRSLSAISSVELKNRSRGSTCH